MFPIVPQSLQFASSSSRPSVSAQNQRSNLLLNYRSEVNKTRYATNLKLNIERIVTDDESAPSKIRTSNDGVFAEIFLKKDTVSHEINSKDLISIPSPTDRKLLIRISPDGFLFVPAQEFTWIRNIKLSTDVHSNNAIIEITPNQKLRLRTSKDIHPGQEVTCWFSENILAIAGIPFLSPVNIIGNNCYSCHLCHVSFESPNPLKVHLAISCGQQSIDVLWLRIHHCVQQNPTIGSPSPPISFGSEPGPIPGYSAFKPISPRKSQIFGPVLSVMSPQSPGISAAATAAQIETLVSNMGASKQGHLCIYCGKIYSRKYGLKIHIRTHTGFKPLKCKFCFRPFGDPSNLNKHVRLHKQANSNVYRCHLCHKILARRRDLQRHMHARHTCYENTEKASSTDDE